MSSSTIGSPHHFIAECVEKDMAVSFYYIYFIVGFADSEPASFTASFATSVDGNQEIVAAALYIQCDFPVVVDDNGAYIQAMRCYRSDGDGVAVSLSGFRTQRVDADVTAISQLYYDAAASS